MEFNGWGIALIALYIVGKYGFKFWLVAMLGGLVKKAKGMMKNGDSNGTEM